LLPQTAYTKSAPRPSIYLLDMHDSDFHQRLEKAYESEKPRFMARLRAAGRGLEEAEDLVHDVYAETMERLHLVAGIHNLPAWINSLFTRRVIDAWRHERVRAASGETNVTEETLREIISGVGLDPQDGFVRDSLMDALNDALRALPAAQRRVVEAQVFGGQTFREMAEATGESIDTLTARKRYALRNLSRALRHWIEE
jgi:RNA polymerase sigma factor (sigma-70 family)